MGVEGEHAPPPAYEQVNINLEAPAPAYPVQQGAYPPQQGYPQQQAYPQQGYPATQPGYPQPGASSGQYPPQQQGYPQSGAPGQYPQQGVPPPQQYPQQGYPPQQYPQQGYPPQQGAYPPPGSPPITINMQNNQTQASAPAVVLLAGPRQHDDFMPSLIIFIIGWFCCFVWAAGFKFIRSTSPIAKALGIASVVMFFLSIIIIVISVVASVLTARAAANAINNSYNTGSSTATVYGSSTAYSSSAYCSMGNNDIYYSASGYVYDYNGNAYSPAGSYCSTCSPATSSYNSYSMLYKCSSSGSYHYAGSAGYVYDTTCASYVYFVPNTLSSSGYGSWSVTCTQY